jgi:hypothetical protein
MEIDDASSPRKPGTYVVTIAADGSETWLAAPNSVVAELVAGVSPPDPVELARQGEEVRQAFGLREVPEEYKPSDWPDCSLDTDEGCAMWIQALYDAMVNHRGSEGADEAIDTFLLGMEWGPDQKKKLRDEDLKHWFALAKSMGLTQEQAARALIDREKRKLNQEGRPSSYRLYTTQSVAALLKEYRRALAGRGKSKAGQKNDELLIVKGRNCSLTVSGREAEFLAQWKVDNE